MLWEHALILGILQGLTEFLPVSSSGHLVLGQSILGLKEPELVFDILLHVGTLAAVLIFYGKDLWRIARGWCASLAGKDPGDGAARTGWLLILGSVPAGIVGVFLGGLVEQMFASPKLAACALLVTGGILCLSKPGEDAGRGEAQMTAKDALIIGIFQAFAIVPGISRSGATIAAALMRGVAREQAARFSFLLSGPRFRAHSCSRLKTWKVLSARNCSPTPSAPSPRRSWGPSPWAGSSGSSEAATSRASAITAGARAHSPCSTSSRKASGRLA